jgi:glycosyltransferase involved in cell wall biosynthesis
MILIFIGCLYPKDRLDEIKKSTGYLDFAADAFQWALLNGFELNSVPVRVITLPNLRDFPKYYNKVYVKSSKFSHRIGREDRCLGFITIPIIKHISKYLTLRHSMIKTIEQSGGIHLIVYGIHSPYLKAVEKIKIKNKRIKAYLIVPDLPEFMSDNQNKVYRFLKNIDEKIIFKSLRYIDGFILLTQHMAGCLPIGDKPFMVMEGIYNTNDNIGEVPKEPYKTILYTGSLERRYGILDLVKAFVRIDRPDYRLWLCGNGDALNEIKKAQKNDTRIRYFGILPRNEALKLQRMATVLVNPRHSSEEYTKYSFPSKTMEYLASGTPTLMCRLPCLPKEYEPYIYFFDDESVEGMRNKIIEICEKSREELGEFGKKAAKFIRDEKNEAAQTKRIIEFIKTQEA